MCVAAEWEDEGASDRGERDEGIEQLGLGGVAGLKWSAGPWRVSWAAGLSSPS